MVGGGWGCWKVENLRQQNSLFSSRSLCMCVSRVYVFSHHKVYISYFILYLTYTKGLFTINTPIYFNLHKKKKKKNEKKSV